MKSGPNFASTLCMSLLKVQSYLWNQLEPVRTSKSQLESVFVVNFYNIRFRVVNRGYSYFDLDQISTTGSSLLPDILLIIRLFTFHRGKRQLTAVNHPPLTGNWLIISNHDSKYQYWRFLPL